MKQPPHTTPASSDKADTPAALYAPAPGVLVCCCSTAVAPERAPAWARGIIQELQPQRLLLLGSMQVGAVQGVLTEGLHWCFRIMMVKLGAGFMSSWLHVSLID